VPGRSGAATKSNILRLSQAREIERRTKELIARGWCSICSRRKAIAETSHTGNAVVACHDCQAVENV
jgi:hypothetical protein